MQIPKILTQRLILRAFTDEDLDAYAAMCADAEGMRYIGTGKTLSRSDAWRNMAMIVGHWYLRGYGMWAVEERKTGNMLGRVGCWNPEGWVGLEIGWSIRREFWRQGFATEAAKAAIEYAFTDMEQSEIISLIHPDNIASRRVAEKVGETVSQTTEVMENKVLIYKLTRDRWQMGK